MNTMPRIIDISIGKSFCGIGVLQCNLGKISSLVKNIGIRFHDTDHLFQCSVNEVDLIPSTGIADFRLWTFHVNPYWNAHNTYMTLEIQQTPEINLLNNKQITDQIVSYLIIHTADSSNLYSFNIFDHYTLVQPIGCQDVYLFRYVDHFSAVDPVSYPFGTISEAHHWVALKRASYHRSIPVNRQFVVCHFGSALRLIKSVLSPDACQEWYTTVKPNFVKHPHHDGWRHALVSDHIRAVCDWQSISVALDTVCWLKHFFIENLELLELTWKSKCLQENYSKNGFTVTVLLHSSDNVSCSLFFPILDVNPSLTSIGDLLVWENNSGLKYAIIPPKKGSVVLLRFHANPGIKTIDYTDPEITV